MALRILNSDLVNSELVAFITPQQHAGEKTMVPVSDRTHPSRGMAGLAGSMHLTGIPVPGMVALDLCWQTGSEEVCMTDEIPSRNININFQLEGCVQARFRGLPHTLDMSPGRHNLVFAPEPGDETRIGRHARLEMFHLSIDREHFTELIGSDNAWAERMLRELEAERPCSGIRGTGIITPAMQQLIQRIRQPSGAGDPMHRLLVHARMLKLLALQFGQFASAVGRVHAPASLSCTDAERLYRLKAWLDQHFLEELSLTGLARSFLLNEFKLKKGFRELFGTTVFGYLKALRMNHAAHLLRDHRLPVEEVAFVLGYEHAHHFSAAFKKHFGHPPGSRIKRGLQ